MNFYRYVKRLFKGLVCLFVLLIALEIILAFNVGRFNYRAAFHSSSRFQKSNFPDYTILCLGESFTYGRNVMEKYSYPFRLWRSLQSREPDKRIIVVNKGHCEDNTNQILGELNSNIMKFNPQMIILLPGAADNLNLISNSMQDKGAFIYRPIGELAFVGGGPRMFKAREVFSLRGLILKSQTYKMLRILYFGFKYKIYFFGHNRNRREIIENLIISKRNKTISEDEVTRIAESYCYQNDFDLVLELALRLIEECPANSKYYGRDLSYYYMVTWASLLTQNNDRSKYVSDYFNRIMISRPEYGTNEVFLAYHRIFKNKDESIDMIDKRFRENLEEIIKICKDRNIKLVIQDYPYDYPAVNAALRSYAIKNNLIFVDNQAVFQRLLKTHKQNSYFEGGVHCTAAGYKIMAENVFTAIKEAIK